MCLPISHEKFIDKKVKEQNKIVDSQNEMKEIDKNVNTPKVESNMVDDQKENKEKESKEEKMNTIRMKLIRMNKIQIP